MHIRVKLLGVFKVRTPPDGAIELPTGATIATALDRLGLCSRPVGVCSVNGRLVRERDHALADDDELLVVPPVGSG